MRAAASARESRSEPVPSGGEWDALSRLEGGGAYTVFARRRGSERREFLSAEASPALETELALFAGAAPPDSRKPVRPKPIDLPDMDVSGTPPVYAGLVEAMAKGGDRRAAVAAVNADQGLARSIADLLRAGATGRPLPVRNAVDAAMRLGPVRLCQMGCLLTLLDMWPGRIGPGPDKHLFREHCLAAGVLSALLAEEMGLGGTDDFFLAGLAHDLGRLVLAVNRPLAAAGVAEHSLDTGAPMTEAEFSRLGYSHATQGSVILSAWPEPPARLRAVLYHHIPDLAPEPVESGVVHLADAMAHVLVLGCSGERFVPRACPATVQALDVSEEMLDRIAGRAVAVMEPLAKVFTPTIERKAPIGAPFEFF